MLLNSDIQKFILFMTRHCNCELDSNCPCLILLEIIEEKGIQTTVDIERTQWIEHHFISYLHATDFVQRIRIKATFTASSEEHVQRCRRRQQMFHLTDRTRKLINSKGIRMGNKTRFCGFANFWSMQLLQVILLLLSQLWNKSDHCIKDGWIWAANQTQTLCQRKIHRPWRGIRIWSWSAGAEVSTPWSQVWLWPLDNVVFVVLSSCRRKVLELGCYGACQSKVVTSLLMKTNLALYDQYRDQKLKIEKNPEWSGRFNQRFQFLAPNSDHSNERL